jgi:hypothetical protein
VPAPRQALAPRIRFKPRGTARTFTFPPQSLAPGNRLARLRDLAQVARRHLARHMQPRSSVCPVINVLSGCTVLGGSGSGRGLCVPDIQRGRGGNRRGRHGSQYSVNGPCCCRSRRAGEQQVAWFHRRGTLIGRSEQCHATWLECRVIEADPEFSKLPDEGRVASVPCSCACHGPTAHASHFVLWI